MSETMERVSADPRVAIGLTLLLTLATLGEGGGSPSGLLAWHGLLVLLLILTVLRASASPAMVAQGQAGTGSPAIPGPIALGWALFLLLCVLGAARAPYAYGALLLLLELAAWSGAAYLSVIAKPGLLRRITTPLALVAALQGAIAVYQSLATDLRPAGSFLVPNHLALWLVAVLLLLDGRAIGGSRAERLQAWVLSPLILAGIASARSRGALLGLAAGGAWLTLVAARRLPPRRRMALGAGAVLLGMLLSAGLLMRARGHDPFRYQRVRIWQASLNGILEEPFWGTGPGQYEAAAANQRFPDGDGPLRYDRAHKATHSDLLRVPAEFGVPAALVLLGTSILALGGIIRRRRAGRLPPSSDGALAATIAICTHALVDNPSRWPAVYLLSAVLVGALLVERGRHDAQGVSSEHASNRRVRGMVGRFGVAAGLVLLFIVIDVAPFLAWRDVSGLPRGRLDGTQLSRLERALELNRLHPDYRMRLAEHLAGGPPSAEAYATAREAAEHSLRLQPADARYRHALARIEARSCRAIFRTEACRERVRGEFTRAAALSRYDPAIPLELALFLLDLGDPLGARRAAERTLALEPEAVLPRLVLAEALIDGGSVAGTRRADDLLVEAVAQAEKWADAVLETRTRPLLDLDPEQLARLRHKIAALPAVEIPAEDSR